MISAAENKELHLVDMTKCVKGIHSDAHHGHDHGEDEHVWLSFDNAGEIVLSICEAVKKAAISNGVDEKVVDTYDKNARQYIDALTTLKGKYLDMVASAKRKMIVVADRFPFVYLVEELGLEYCAAFPGCSTETNASFAVQMELIEKTKDNGIPVVFMTPACCSLSNYNDLQVSTDANKKADAKPLLSYVEVIQKTAEQFQIPVLDLYHNLGIDPKNPEDRKQYTADGLHFNDAGQYVLAQKLKAFLQAL
jgi:zinc transport system substrate-binding protein